jgi:hypothetical protein
MTDREKAAFLAGISFAAEKFKQRVPLTAALVISYSLRQTARSTSMQSFSPSSCWRKSKKGSN